uniref:ORF2 n=1 Tax=Dioscorea bacilliform AL virus TaxID=1619899 RepID=A0A4Y1PJ38_9VIRU|nr:ORF2 [Dioscorea bacilliform AL virus]AYH52651.1 ORF2 [Dioscorea bacilliform AL virus]AYH52654.1 ORF2 [Dioscorea bacilliform AL virus]AYH52666.1 ORF2 [Dioscorea bacilliform AL virus]
MSEELIRALKAVEHIEPPAVGFVKSYDYQNKLAGAVAASQKQNNTILQLLIHLFEKVAEVKADLEVIKRQLAAPTDREVSDNLLDQVISKLGKLSLATKVPEKPGKLLVWKDPALIYEEELEKLS